MDFIYVQWIKNILQQIYQSLSDDGGNENESASRYCIFLFHTLLSNQINNLSSPCAGEENKI